MSFFLIIMCFHSLRSKALFRNKRIRIFLIYIVIKKIPVESTTSATDKFERKVLTMRTKENFTNDVAALVNEKLGSGYTVSARIISKNNDTLRHALEIRKVNSRIAPVIYVDSLYNQYCEDKLDMDSIVDEIMDTYEESMMHDNVSDYAENLTNSFSREYILENVCFKVINENMNCKNLSTIPHEHIAGELTAVFFVSLDDNASVLITNAMCNLYCLTTDELLESSYRNTPVRFPMIFKNLMNCLFESDEAEDILSDDSPEIGNDLYVLSNATKRLGASVILYKGVLKTISEKFDSDLYIIPSSIHEVIITKDSNDPDTVAFLNSTIMEVNSTQVSKDEVLSNQLYHYNRELDLISVA